MASHSKKRTLDNHFMPLFKKQKLETWSCNQCTFDNSMHLKQWKTCGTQRDKNKGKDLKCVRFNLKNNSLVLWYKDFLDLDFSKILFDELKNIKYEQPSLVIYGKKRNLPRLQSWMSSGKISNKKANLYQKQKSLVWSENMLTLKTRLERICGVTFAYCLIQKYRNGKDHIGYHCDDEAKHKECNVIASVSLGQTRKFVLRHKEWKNDKKNKDLKHEFMLSNGSLIVMKNDTQMHWKPAKN